MVRKKTVKKSNKKEEIETISIDWKIPAAFIAGILITSLVFTIPNMDLSNNDTPTPVVEDAEVSLIVLNDATCTICDDSWIEDALITHFSNMNVEYVDASSAQGQELINELSVTTIPAAFFASDVEQASNFTLFLDNSWLSESGDYYQLHILGVKDLTRAETSNPTIDLFVMSECPYGIPAQQNLINAHDLIPDFDLRISYIGNVITEEEMSQLPEQNQEYYRTEGCVEGNNSKFYCALHGVSEVMNNVAQLCAIEYYEDWEEFILSHIENDFDDAAAIAEMGYNETLMNECINSDIGLTLFEDSLAVPEEFGLGGSPSYVFDNVIPVRLGYTPVESYDPIVLLCTLHPTLSGCESTDTLETAQATGSC